MPQLVKLLVRSLTSWFPQRLPNPESIFITSIAHGYANINFRPSVSRNRPREGTHADLKRPSLQVNMACRVKNRAIEAPDLQELKVCNM